MDVQMDDQVQEQEKVTKVTLQVPRRTVKASTNKKNRKLPGHVQRRLPNKTQSPPAPAKNPKYFKKLHIASVGLLFNVAAYYALINLQSSLNVRDSLGTIGLTIGYISSVFWALLLTPVAIDHLGPKMALIVSEASYIVYCAANFYPGFVTLIPASVILGFGEACCWASMSVIVTYYGEQYWKLTQNRTAKPVTSSQNATSLGMYGGADFVTSSVDDALTKCKANRSDFSANKTARRGGQERSKDATVSFFFGRYFFIVKAGQIIGNLLSYVSLYGAKLANKPKADHVRDDDIMVANYTTTYSPTTTNALYNFTQEMTKNESYFQVCGVNDCTTTFKKMSSADLKRYMAESRLSVNLLLCGLIAMHAVAISIHYFLLDDIPKKREVVREDPNAQNRRKRKGCVLMTYSVTSLVNKGRPRSLSLTTKDLELIQGCWKKSTNSVISVFRQMASLQQLLVSPISLYFGLFLSYSLSEFTRAFVSCTMGVENVGLIMMLFGASSMTSALFLGKFIPKFGRNPLYVLAVVVDVVSYVSNFLWAPSSGTIYAVYLMAVAFGFNAGLWEPLINSTYAHYFAENTSAAFSVWNFWGACGLFTGFALSATVCLVVKLYVLLATLGVAILCYALAEARFRGLSKIDPTNQKQFTAV